MHDATIADFLDRLAARIPAPGGGAVAALHLGQGAALLGMVARYTTGEKYAEHAATVAQIIEETDRWRFDAVSLAAADASAFTAVTDAYQLPKVTPDDKAARSAEIAAALVGAARVPADVVAAARVLTGLAEQLLPIGNRNVITDVAAAAESLRAAAATARVNIEINLGGITNEQARAALREVADSVDAILAHADAITATVRREIAK